MPKKRTVRDEVSFSGVGVHSGKKVNLRLLPSDEGEVIFCRLDLKNAEFALDANNVESKNCSALVGPEGTVRTVEHLMASLYGLGIDSASVELDSDEVPILDGSAAQMAAALEGAGTQELSEEREFWRIARPFAIEDGESSIHGEPDSVFRISYRIEFAHPAIGRQEASFVITPQVFLSEVAPARTFGFLKDLDSLRSQGLALGASLENTVALDDRKVINPPLRFPDEFVRHKVLDLIGDLSFLRRPLLGHVRAIKAGHNLHLRAVRFLLDQPDVLVKSSFLV